MAITTLDGLIASTKQRVRYTKTVTRATVANGWFSLFDLAGQPGAGTLAIGNIITGQVQTDATAGYPLIDAFGAGASGYLGRVAFGNTVACRIAVFDRLFVAGAYAFNANQALSSQAVFSGRVCGSDPEVSGLENLDSHRAFEPADAGFRRRSGTRSSSSAPPARLEKKGMPPLPGC